MRAQDAIFRGATLIGANSGYTASEVRRRIGSTKPIVVLPPPVTAAETDQPTPIPGRVVVAARLVPSKGVDHALHAVARLPEASLLVAGDGPERFRLEQLAKDLELSERVHFIGWVPLERVDREIQRSEVVLFPSLWPEPFGQVPARAAQLCRPIVGYRVGGAATWLHKDAAALVPPANLNALTEALRHLLGDAERRHRLAETAHSLSKQLTRPHFAQRIERAVQSAVLLRHAEDGGALTRTAARQST